MSTERILVVEDEVRVAQALYRVLSMPAGGGHLVDTCDSADTALERLRAIHYDLLIADLRMSGMSGLELLERVRHQSPTTRSVLITAYGSLQVEERARDLANAYLPKPFSRKDMVSVVKQTLSILPTRTIRLMAISEEGLCAIQGRIEALRFDVGAMGIYLFDQSGQLLTETGPRGAFDTTAFLALLGNTMSAANQVSRILQDQGGFDLHFHEGQDYELYAAHISDQVFLSLIVARQINSSRIGMVWLALRRAVAELRVMLKQATLASVASLGETIEDAFATALEQALGEPDSLVDPLPVAPVPPPARKPRTRRKSVRTSGSHLPDELKPVTDPLAGPAEMLDFPPAIQAAGFAPVSSADAGRVLPTERQAGAPPPPATPELLDSALPARTKATDSVSAGLPKAPALALPFAAKDALPATVEIPEDLQPDTLLSYEQARRLGLIRPGTRDR